MNNRKVFHGLFYFFLCLILAVFLFDRLIPKAASRVSPSEISQSDERPILHYIAIGDSLTEGVGDTTGQGGFVPLLAQDLANQLSVDVVDANYGIAGNTSNQILKRMKSDKKLQADLKRADLMTLTVGGNDLRKVIMNNITDLKVSSFNKPSKDYAKRLKEIIDYAHKQNKDLPIYVVGIYNPFFLSFPEMTEMQTIVDNWNEVTAKTLEEQDKVYFVPINDLLYKGLEEEVGVSSTDAGTRNNLLYNEDSFHPNNTGYEIMKKAIVEKIHETQKEW
ncbi:SGNH/GDSL hydrolase family protein [Streptococcus suis]|uniref:SGNH/GDSL hydrolase family protein n=1 Tax=Streptococcus suis TaxID=1307 RepID=UPI000CF43604|nr:SGNH/GDSL hydrolase family protein [Streptococcus suis]